MPESSIPGIAGRRPETAMRALSPLSFRISRSDVVLRAAIKPVYSVRYELESPSFRKMVTHGAFAAAVATDWAETLARTNVDPRTLAILTQHHVLVHVFPEFPDLP
jgi:hypothetical protein